MKTTTNSRRDSDVMYSEDRRGDTRSRGQAFRDNYENSHDNYDQFENSSRPRNERNVNDDEDYDDRDSLRNSRRSDDHYMNELGDVRDENYRSQSPLGRNWDDEQTRYNYNRNSQQNEYSRRGFGSMGRHSFENERDPGSYSNSERRGFYSNGDERDSYSRRGRDSYSNGERGMEYNDRNSYSNGDRRSGYDDRDLYSNGERRRNYDDGRRSYSNNERGEYNDERRVNRGYEERQYTGGYADEGRKYNDARNEEGESNGNGRRNTLSSIKGRKTSASELTSSNGRKSTGRTAKKSRTKK